MNSLSSSPSSLHQHMSTIGPACSERSAGGERGGDGEETLERIVWMIVIVWMIIIVEAPRKRFESDELGKRQIGVSGVEGERVWKRAGGSAAAGCCWGHFLFFLLFFFFFGVDFWEGLEVFFLIFIWMVLVDAVINIDIDVVVLYNFFFSNLKSGLCEDPKPEAEVKWNTVGWK